MNGQAAAVAYESALGAGWRGESSRADILSLSITATRYGGQENEEKDSRAERSPPRALEMRAT
jgi:hypothetical protein